MTIIQAEGGYWNHIRNCATYFFRCPSCKNRNVVTELNVPYQCSCSRFFRVEEPEGIEIVPPRPWEERKAEEEARALALLLPGQAIPAPKPQNHPQPSPEEEKAVEEPVFELIVDEQKGEMLRHLMERVEKREREFRERMMSKSQDFEPPDMEHTRYTGKQEPEDDSPPLPNFLKK